MQDRRCCLISKYGTKVWKELFPPKINDVVLVKRIHTKARFKVVPWIREFVGLKGRITEIRVGIFDRREVAAYTIQFPEILIKGTYYKEWAFEREDFEVLGEEEE